MIKRWVSRVDDQKAEQGGARSWWRWPLLLVLVLAGLAVAAWIVRRDRLELAKLRHEKNKAEIEQDNARAELLANVEEGRVRDALAEVRESTARVAELTTRLRKAKEKYNADQQAIARLSWRDLRRAE